MHYLEFLGRVHHLFEPRTYLEIGVRQGDSLTLSDAPAIGIDPTPDLVGQTLEHATVFRQTSDEYFGMPDPLAPFGGRPIDLAFIDGMHLIEFALRDFTNVERHSHPGGVVILDDVFPPTPAEAVRERRTQVWTGDVYKIVDVLASTRPDLKLIEVDTEPTGVLLVFGLDPGNTILADSYDALVTRTVKADPQHVPERILDRRDAESPDAVLSAPFWSDLRGLRGSGP
jgi:hypothetical protein